MKCTQMINSAIGADDTICPNCISTILPFNGIQDDEEFLYAISGNSSIANVDYDKLSRIKLELHDHCDAKRSVYEENLDADTNYYNTHFSSTASYLGTDQINKILLNNEPKLQSLLHINARSLAKNRHNIITELSLLNNQFSVIGMSEIWTKQDEVNPDIPGYSSFIKSRPNCKTGGGVGLYIKNDLYPKAKLRDDLYSDPLYESLFIQINQPGRDALVGIIYKPPDVNLDEYNVAFDNLLKQLSNETKPCFILGDFNINLLKHNMHKPTENFLNMLLSYGYYPLIDKPTRITTDTATLIDNIITNVHEMQLTSGIWTVDITDHLPVFLILPQNQRSKPHKVIINKRQTDESRICSFKNELSVQNWDEILKDGDVNEKYDALMKTVHKLYDKNFPLISHTLHVRNIHRPWITKAIRNSIKKKSTLYKKFLKSRTQAALNKYKIYRNKLTAVLRKAEKCYYASKLEAAKHNLQKTWKVINTIILRKKAETGIPSVIQNNQTVNDPKEMADIFNNFFANIGQDLAKKIPKVDANFRDYLTGSIPQSIFLNPTTACEITTIIAGLKNSDSKGYDELSVCLLKKCSYELVLPLTSIFNQSILEGTVPDQLKIAKVVPVYKSENRSLVSNYRPISVLPAISKILEKLVYNRVIDFINEHNILNDSQYGFRKKYSTYMALIDLTDSISECIDTGDVTVGIFLDLAKAFDTVNHKILLGKLSHYGIRGTALDWFCSYLNNRLQYVCVNKVNSSYKQICCGVPQGSILGPLLFLLYINDLPKVSTYFKFIMFADDTNIFAKGKDIDNLVNNINYELEHISKWFGANLLSLNIKKTNYILFGNKTIPSQKIMLSNTEISRVQETKFLGVIIQEKLNWSCHINLIKSKISKTIGIIYRARHNLPKTCLITLYHSLVEPYINYCNIVWASRKENVHLEKILRLQKRAIRSILFLPRTAHTASSFNRLGILTVYNIYSHQTLLFVYKSLAGMLPKSFCEYFRFRTDIHNYSTRISLNKLYIPRVRTTCRKNMLTVQGPLLWNQLPPIIKSCKSIHMFKKHSKQFLMSV